MSSSTLKYGPHQPFSSKPRPAQRRSLDSSIACSNGNYDGITRRYASSSSSSSSSSSRKPSSSSSSSSCSSTADSKLNPASPQAAAAWVWHQRHSGQNPTPVTARGHRRNASADSPSTPHLPKSCFSSEPCKPPAEPVQLPAIPLFDAFELSNIKAETAQPVHRLQHEPIPEDRDDEEFQMREEEEEEAGEEVELSAFEFCSSLHVNPMEAQRDLQYSTTNYAATGSSSHVDPPHRPRVRHRSLDSAAYRDMGFAAGQQPATSEGTRRSHHPSFAKPFSAVHKLFQKISKAVKPTNPKLNMNQNAGSTRKEGFGHQYHIYHHHHHHYHHHHNLYEEDCDLGIPDETYAMVSTRRFPESGNVVVYSA